MANVPEPQPIPGLSALAGEYRALLCDVWGVIHNGVAAFPEAAAALTRYREEGGTVLLLTNAPRRKENVVGMLDTLGFPRAGYDDVVTSGEAGRDLLRERATEVLAEVREQSLHDLDHFADYPPVIKWLQEQVAALSEDLPQRAVEDQLVGWLVTRSEGST